MADILHTAFSEELSWKIFFLLFKFHWSLFVRSLRLCIVICNAHLPMSLVVISLSLPWCWIICHKRICLYGTNPAEWFYVEVSCLSCNLHGFTHLLYYSWFPDVVASCEQFFSDRSIWKICPHQVLTHWGWDKVAAISQTTLSNSLSWMKTYELWLRLHWSLFLRVQLTIF